MGNNFIYEQAVKSEIYSDLNQLSGEDAAIMSALAEIRALGYDWNYYVDFQFHSVSDKRVMGIILKYYPQMESIYTKAMMIDKVKPRFFPQVLDYAFAEFNELSPSGKLGGSLIEFERAISKGPKTSEYDCKLLSMLSTPINYASMYECRKRLCKRTPSEMRKYTDYYSNGWLLKNTMFDRMYYSDDENSAILERLSQITDAELNEIVKGQSYSLDPTTLEYCKSTLSAENVRSYAKEIIKKISKKRDLENKSSEI